MTGLKFRSRASRELVLPEVPGYAKLRVADGSQPTSKGRRRVRSCDRPAADPGIELRDHDRGLSHAGSGSGKESNVAVSQESVPGRPAGRDCTDLHRLHFVYLVDLGGVD